jgi:hypothetical protein
MERKGGREREGKGGESEHISLWYKIWVSIFYFGTKDG